MNESKRHESLVNLVNARQNISVSEIIDAFKISAATARRDITKLSQQGKVKKVRNGVVKIETKKEIWSPLKNDHTYNYLEKANIARKASMLCEDGDSIILNCGSTAFLLGKELCGKAISIITNYFPLASYLIENDHENVIIMGGQYNKTQNIILSPINGLSDIYTGKLMFTSGKGLTPSGLYKTEILTALSEQQILNNIEKLVVVVDSSKVVPHIATGMLFCPSSKIDIIITGKSANKSVVNSLVKQGIEVILV